MTLPRRIRVVGNSGSGKSTLGRRAALRLGLPYLELDSVQHRAGWVEAPTDEFRAEVEAFRDRSEAASGGWVVDGNYERKLGSVLDGADCLVWLDLPRWRVMARVVRRTLLRLVDRQELWNGNRERWSGVVRRAPEDNIVLWAWTQHATYRERCAAASREDPERWVRLRTPRDVRLWLRSLDGRR